MPTVRLFVVFVLVAVAGGFVPPVSARQPAVRADPVEHGVPAVVVTASPPSAPTATFVTFTVQLHGVGGDGTYRVDYGDGRDEGFLRHATGCAPPLGDPVTLRFRHAYRRARPHVFRFSYRQHDACSPANAGGLTFTGSTAVDVTPGASPSNGPEPVRVLALAASPAGPARAWVDLRFEDYDGFVTEIRYRWGHGSDTVFTIPQRRCVDPPDHWPRSDESTVPADASRVAHAFPRGGTYTVAVIVTATGCDGRDRQTASRSVPVRVG